MQETLMKLIPLFEPEKHTKIINHKISDSQSENCIFALLKTESNGEMRDILKDVGTSRQLILINVYLSIK